MQGEILEEDHISRKFESRKVIVGPTLTILEYPELSNRIHGAVGRINGRYPEKGRVVNTSCTEFCFVLEGYGKLVIEGKEIRISRGRFVDGIT